MDTEREALMKALDEQAAVLESLRQRLARLEAASSSGAAPDAVDAAVAEPAVEESGVASRRGFLRLAGIAAAGAVVGVVARPDAAAATDGQAVVQGANNTGALSTIVTNNANIGSQIDTSALSGVGPAGGIGLFGSANGSTAAGVEGVSDSGYGVWGASSAGYALFAGGNGRIGMNTHVTTAPPTSGTYRVGDLVVDGSGNLVVCVTAGSPGAWRKLAGPATAGSLHLFSAPLRAYDSRPGQVGGGAGQAATGGDGVIATGGNRTISLLNGNDSGGTKAAVPAGARAALFNLTLTSTVGGGFVSVNAGGQAYSGTSTLNWGASGATLAGSVTSAVNASAQIIVYCPAGSTHVIVDVIGYYV